MYRDRKLGICSGIPPSKYLKQGLFDHYNQSQDVSFIKYPKGDKPKTLFSSPPIIWSLWYSVFPYQGFVHTGFLLQRGENRLCEAHTLLLVRSEGILSQECF